MVLAGLGDAWIRFLGARDSARLAPRHSQRTPLPSSAPGPRRRRASIPLAVLESGLRRSFPTLYNHGHTYGPLPPTGTLERGTLEPRERRHCSVLLDFGTAIADRTIRRWSPVNALSRRLLSLDIALIAVRELLIAR